MSSCGDRKDFVIPKGLDFKFTVQIMEEDSFLPQILTDYSDGSLTIIDLATGASIAGFPVIPLTKIPETVIAAIPVVVEETTLSIATLAIGEYSITVNDTTYSVIYTVAPTTLAQVATDLYAQMAVLPMNITAVLLNNTITIKETTGVDATISFSERIAMTDYLAGTEAKDGYTRTFYNDNGYLQGEMLSAVTTLLEVSRAEELDDYYLKPKYQGVIQVNFSDNTLDKTAIICEVYVAYTGN